MRSCRRHSLILLFGVLACSQERALAESQTAMTSPHLAKVEGINLFVEVAGEKPCDYMKDRLITSVAFVLNSASLPFNNFEAGETMSREWPVMSVVANALVVPSGCVWTISTKLYVMVSGGTALGEPFNQASIIWENGAYGTSQGNGLSAYVATFAENQMKKLVNDIHASQKYYPDQ